MGDEQAISDFPDEQQRAAVAYSTYRDEEMEEMELGGVSILEVGEAKGHDLFVDKTSLETALKIMQKAKNGVKIKMNHGSGLEAVCGFARNPRIEGDKLVADLRLLRNSPHYGLIKEMASEAPDQFGISLAFVNESETIDGKDYIRPQSIASADLVSSPAATNGLFEEMVKFMEKLGYVQGGKSIPAVAKEAVEEAPLDKKDKTNMENTDYKKDMDEIKVRLSALEEAMKPKDEEKKEEMASEAPKIVIEKEDEDEKEETKEEMSEVVKKVLTEFGIKPISASPVVEAPAKVEPKTFEALVAAHSDYSTSKLKAMQAVMLSNPKEYSEALSRGITKL
jgi:gas vesicle protein